MSKEDQKQRLKRKYDDILLKYRELAAKKYKGKTRLYSDETILEMLSEEFYLAPRTIDDIVCGRKR